MKSSGKTAEEARALAAPVAESLGYFIWDVEYIKEGTEWFLRTTIDSENGIGIEDCEKMSRAMDPVLDEADIIEGSYRLEISSPGIERELRRDAHFEKCIGQKIKIKLIRPLDGQREFKGTLESFDNGEISVRFDDGSGIIINKKEASYIKLDDFGGELNG